MMLMDGYVITPNWEDAIAAFEDPTVRHAAKLDTGEGFVAYEGDHVPAEGLRLFNDPDQEGMFARVRKNGPQVRVRKNGPQFSDEPETFVRVTMEHFLSINPLCIRMASVLTDGSVLLVTTPDAVPPGSARWSASAEWFLDKRLGAPELV